MLYFFIDENSISKAKKVPPATTSTQIRKSSRIPTIVQQQSRSSISKEVEVVTTSHASIVTVKVKRQYTKRKAAVAEVMTPLTYCI